MKTPSTLEELIEALRCLPGVGPKSAQRMAYHLLQRDMPGAQRLAVTSGGTIPDRGLYGVFLAGGDGPGRRVGELDEEMVYESRPGETFLLGASTWRIEEITHERVIVTPAPGQPGKMPFWHGDAPGRPLELGRALGAFLREVGSATPEAGLARSRAAGLDEWGIVNLLAYLAEVTVNQPHGPAPVSVDPATKLPEVNLAVPAPDGTRQLLLELGPDEFARRLRAQDRVAVTDTTFRDAHQSLLATRVRTKDLLAVAGHVARTTPEL